MKPYTANGCYHVPIVGYHLNVVGECPAWFDNFYRHCERIAGGNMFGHPMPPNSAMNRELKDLGGSIIPLDTQEGWMLTLPSESSYTMLMLKWSMKE